MTTVGMLAIVLAVAATAQNPGAPVTGEKSYYPLAVGNWWLYTVKEPFKQRTSTVKWEVIRKEEEDTFGSRAYQLSSTPAQDDTPLYLAARENGIGYPGTGTDGILVKSPLHTGDRWKDQRSSEPARYEVVSAGKACVVGGRRFGDCAIIREFTPRLGASELVSLVTYARGVGPVEYVYYNEHDPKKIESTVTIRSWHVKSAGNE